MTHLVWRPLHLQPGDVWREARSRLPSPFTAQWGATLTELRREAALLETPVRMVGASWEVEHVVEVDLLRGDFTVSGPPRAGAKGVTPRVAVNIDSRHGRLRYLCDRFDHWQANVRAVVLALEALRKVDRYGIGARGEQYVGWAALPSPPPGGPLTREAAAEVLIRHSHWTEVPDVPTFLRTPERMARVAYRRASMAHHPDHGGNPDTFRLIIRARDALSGVRP